MSYSQFPSSIPNTSFEPKRPFSSTSEESLVSSQYSGSVLNGSKRTKIPSTTNGLTSDYPTLSSFYGNAAGAREINVSQFQSFRFDTIQRTVKIWDPSHPEVEVVKHLVLTKKSRPGNNPHHSSFKRIRPISANTQVEITLPMWNYSMHRSEKMPLDPSEVLEPNEVFEKWAIDGVVRSQNTADISDLEIPYQFTSVASNGSGGIGDKRIYGARTVTNTVWGVCRTYNLWKEDLIPGTPLFLILKKVFDNRGEYQVASDDINGFERLQGIGSKITNKPYKLIPWASVKEDYPPLSILEFYDEFGIKRIGKVIRVGRMDKAPHVSSLANYYGTDLDVANNVLVVMRRPDAEIILEPFSE